jgi:hypothetical protein
MLDRTEPALLLAAPRTDWALVLGPSVPVLVIERAPPVDPAAALSAVAGAGAGTVAGTWRFAGSPEAVRVALQGLPSALAADIHDLVQRFAALTDKATVRVRLEAVDGDACRKFHADYTDLRLVTTYAGPGTDIRTTTAEDSPVHRIRAGDIALFKGRLFPGEPPVLLHRSPPIEGTGERRIVLVLDTPGAG